MAEIFAVRILYMEDDPGLSRLMQKNLQRMGYVVDTAANGDEGLAMLGRARYDLVLLDYNMPFCGGIDVIRTLSEQGALPPTIMVTAEGNVEVAVEALKLGASDYVVKDTEMKYLELLPSVIDQVLDKQRLLREQQEMFQAVQQSEERYRLLFETNPLPLWVTDLGTGSIFEVNQAAVTHYGFSRKEFLAFSAADLIAPGEAAPPDIAQGAGMEKRVTLTRHRKKNGDIFEVELVSHRMMFGGKPSEVVLASDVSERKRRDEEHIRSQKLESLGNLAGGLAHDFNNILTVIMGNISLARLDAEEGKDVIGRLDEAERASLRARDLAYQLLTFSKGGAPVKRVISLCEVIQDAAEFALRGAKTRAEFTMPRSLPFVEADEGQIRQVVGNIVTNADQAMPDGGVLTVGCESVTIGRESELPLGPGQYVRISFIDHGVGIGPDVLSKIFDPYFTTRQKASGLGLATSYSIIKRHNGIIQVDSAPGTGSTFTMYLPESSQRAEPQAAETAAPREPAPRMAQRRILVMDDEPMVRNVAGMMLAHLGLETGFARDGAEAIAVYEEARKTGRPFDAVIMDLTIPGGMGGREAIVKLREIDPDVRAIVSSGYSNDPVMADHKAFGFAGIVPKPYTIQRLRDAVEQVLGG